ncbi:MAG: hypothetical protein HC768_19165 [Acaryochloris sp. CRU_2_0]|nr:hypothetical protein [Acaryochloris sp. CRU_2_0]
MCRETGKHGFEWEGDRATCHSTLTTGIGGSGRGASQEDGEGGGGDGVVGCD